MIGKKDRSILFCKTWPGPGALSYVIYILSRFYLANSCVVRRGMFLKVPMSGADMDMKCYAIDNTNTMKY